MERIKEIIKDYKFYSRMLHNLSKKKNKQGIIKDIKYRLWCIQTEYEALIRIPPKRGSSIMKA